MGSGDGAKYGTSADIYSLGMVIFEMVSGQEPFQGLSTMQAAFAVSTGKRPSFKNHPTKAILQFMIRICWNTRASMRPDLQELYYLAKLVSTEYCAEWLPDDKAGPDATVYDMMIPQCPEECATTEVLRKTPFADYVALRDEQENGIKAQGAPATPRASMDGGRDEKAFQSEIERQEKTGGFMGKVLARFMRKSILRKYKEAAALA